MLTCHQTAERFASGAGMNKLFYGDNLDVLREYVEPESVDLIYLDPPFNSQARYNVLFESAAEDRASAQVEAFRDTWTWGDEAEANFQEILALSGPTARLVSALQSALGRCDMMAYLTMMALRLHELHRVLKPTGSLYLHCDPTASHYLKLLLDGIFGPQRFQNEIIWKRHSAHNSAKRYGPVHDVILFYSKGDRFTWTNPRMEYEQDYLDKYYKYDDGDGRLYWRNSLTAAGTRQGSSGQSWRGFDPASQGSHWKFTIENLEGLDAAGKIYWPPGGGWPQIKRYRDELQGRAVGDIWDDIDKINPAGNERMGYPTQKPVALLKRLIAASSNTGDVILDPFCGCGTTIQAAEHLGRQWIGIDVAYYAVRLIRHRLSQAFGESAKYELLGLPRDFEQACALAERDKFQFQWWANSVVGVHAFREVKKGPDRGIDGEIFFLNGPRPAGRILTSVKGGQHVGVGMISAFRGVLDRENADMGLFVCLEEPTKHMVTEAASAGFVRTAHGQFPRLQIVALSEWFAGKRPGMPPLMRIDPGNFATRQRRIRMPRPDPAQPQLPLVFEGGKSQAQDGTVIYLNPDIAVAPRAQAGT